MSTDHVTPHTNPLEPVTPLNIVGVDTHKHAHIAVAITRLGARVAACRTSANREGYAALLAWARALGAVETFAVEGTGSYGAGLASFLRRHVVRVVEVTDCDRRKRRRDGLAQRIPTRTPCSKIGTRHPTQYWRPPRFLGERYRSSERSLAMCSGLGIN